MALKCHVCTREKNATCERAITHNDFAEDCAAYTNYCAMLSVDNVIEVRGCMSTFTCSNTHKIKCCLCSEDLCNQQIQCHAINKSTNTKYYFTKFVISLILFFSLIDIYLILNFKQINL